MCRFQEFRKLRHNNRQDGNHERKVSDPVLPVRCYDLRHELFLRHGLIGIALGPERDSSLLLLFLSLPLAFQIFWIDPVVFSHDPTNRWDEGPVILGHRQSIVVIVVHAVDHFSVAAVVQSNIFVAVPVVGQDPWQNCFKGSRCLGMSVSSIPCSPPPVAFFCGSFLEHPTGSAGLLWWGLGSHEQVACRSRCCQ